MLLSEEQLITEVNIMVNETIRKLQEMRLSVMAKLIWISWSARKNLNP